MSNGTIQASVQVPIGGSPFWLVAMRTEDPASPWIEVYWQALLAPNGCHHSVVVWEKVPFRHWGDLLKQAIETELRPLIAETQVAA